MCAVLSERKRNEGIGKAVRGKRDWNSGAAAFQRNGPYDYILYTSGRESCSVPDPWILRRLWIISQLQALERPGQECQRLFDAFWYFLFYGKDENFHRWKTLRVCGMSGKLYFCGAGLFLRCPVPFPAWQEKEKRSSIRRMKNVRMIRSLRERLCIKRNQICRI